MDILEFVFIFNVKNYFKFHNPNMGQAPGLPPPPQSQNMPDGMFPVGYFNGTRGGPQPGPSQSSNQASPIPGNFKFFIKMKS